MLSSMSAEARLKRLEDHVEKLAHALVALLVSVVLLAVALVYTVALI